MDDLIIYTDGASQGNPGPAGIGVVITDGAGATVRELSEHIGEVTNNIAEYQALLRGLEEAKVLGARRVKVYADSELMVKQMIGAYQVKNEGLRPLYLAARALSREFAGFTVEHIPREKNKRADKLSKAGVKAAPAVEAEPAVDAAPDLDADRAADAGLFSESEPAKPLPEAGEYAVRWICSSGTKADEGLTIIYEAKDGSAGRVKLTWQDDLRKISFTDAARSVVRLRPSNDAKQNMDLVELRLSRG